MTSHDYDYAAVWSSFERAVSASRLVASDSHVSVLEQRRRIGLERIVAGRRSPRELRHVPPPPLRPAHPDPEAAGEAGRVQQLRAAIATRLEWGDTLETVERELIVPCVLSEEQQSALLLYASSHPNRRAASQPRLSVWAALANALLTLIGIYRS